MVVARQAVATVGAYRVNANRVGSATVTTWPTFCLALINIGTVFAVTGVAGRAVAGVGCLQVDALRTSVTHAIRRSTVIHSWALFTAFIGDGELLGWWA